MVEFLQDDVKLLEGWSDLPDIWVVCSQVESLIDLNEGGCGLHVDEGLFGLLSLSLSKASLTSTPFSMTYLAQEISSWGILYFFSSPADDSCAVERDIFLVLFILYFFPNLQR